MDIQPIPESEMENLVTPFFMHMSIENVPQSEIQKRPVMEIREVVQLRFAGDSKYSPVLPVEAMYRLNGHEVVTYAERFADQYRQFQSNAEQTASGTPLDLLVDHGITPAQLSLCRTAKVYSIEALNALEKPGLNMLGQSANALKEMARRYMADRASGFDSERKIRELEERIAQLQQANPLPAQEPTADEMAEALQVADDEYGMLSNDDLKERIKSRIGHKPQGNPSRETLLQSLRELEGAA